jgi:outer membrane receptor protein involved in Fe transport
MYGLTTGQRFAEINQDPSRGAVPPAGAPCTLASFKYLLDAQGQQIPNPGGSGACIPLAELPGNVAAFRNQDLVDTEIAGFGEVTLKLTDRLRLLGGLRVSQVEFRFAQVLYGINQGWNVPTTLNGGLVSGVQRETPILPKGGIQYLLTPNDQVYVTASKGFRPGGVNSPISATLCIGLSQAGLTPKDIPTTYNSDSVWSYETGGKFRLFGNRVAINTSLYRIDWTNVQVSIPTAGCGQTYNTNAGAARSQGFDLETQARVFEGFTVGVAAGYDDAQYITTTTGPKPLSGAAPTVVINKGDRLAVPPWAVSASAQYDHEVASGFVGYLHADYRFTSSYQVTAGPGASGYAPDAFRNPDASVINARLGVVHAGADIALFVNNLFDSDDFLSKAGGRSGCNVTTGAACPLYSSFNPLTSVTTFRPREVGLQVTFRH